MSEYYTKEELIEAIKTVKPNLADSSIKAYINQINNLALKLIDIKQVPRSPEWIIDIPVKIVLGNIKYKENGEELNITSRRNTLTALLTYLNIYKDSELSTIFSLIDKYGAEVKRLNDKQNKRYKKDKVSSATKEKLQIQYPQLLQAIDNMIGDNPDKVSPEDALLFTLITKYHYRNEVGSLELITKGKYDKMSKERKLENNFIVKRYNDYFISRGIYKTNSKYGLIITDLKEDKQTSKQIGDFIKNVMKKRTGREQLIFFPGNTGGLMPNELVSQRVGRLTEKLFGVRLGTSSINKIYMNSLDSSTIEELKQLSANRGTSIATLILAYYNKEI